MRAIATGRVATTDGHRSRLVPRWAWWATAAFLALAIAVVSMLPPTGTPGMDIADLGELRALAGHAFAYFALAATLSMAQERNRWVLTFIGVGVFGLALEVAQGLGGARSAQLIDVAANMTGALLGVWVARWFLRSSG